MSALPAAPRAASAEAPAPPSWQIFISRLVTLCLVELRKVRHDRTELYTRAIQPTLWLLIFGQATSLIDPFSGGLARWAALFGAWPDRALLTPEPLFNWGAAESAVASGGFLVATWGQAGLRWVADRFNGDLGAGPPEGISSPTRLPRLLSARPRRWLESDAPPTREVESVFE